MTQLNLEVVLKILRIEELEYLHCGPISLQVEASECIGLSGESGSGKSQMLRVLADLEPHSGDVWLDDLNQQSLPAPDWRKAVALLPAETVWWFDTVGEHFDGLDVEVLKKLGFEKDISDWSVSRLSSGEKQRLGLVRLLQNKPQVLLLDEPTANLDNKNETLFEAFVQEYLQHHDACAFWVSHDQEQLARVSTKRYWIDQQGQVAEC